ncbi:hypothetical protein QQP08_011938, partial [Theobroma cacao]
DFFLVINNIFSTFQKKKSNEKEVVKYGAEMMPILAISSFVGRVQSALSGAMVGDCSCPSSTNGIVSSHYSRDRLGERGKSLPILEGGGLLNFLFILHFSLNSSLWGNSTHFSLPI